MISCDIFSLLQHDPLAPLSADGTTAAQLVFGKGMPAGGLFCPGTSPAGPCPAGSYCPEPLTSLTCPEGHFCPMQSMNPLACSWVSHCPAGSSLPQITWGTYIGIWTLALTLLLLWWSVMSWLQRRRVQRLQKCRQEVAARRLSGLQDKQAAGCELARYSALLFAITVRK
ncbi:TPA: hypothetical protein ACH3X2_003355 [Trebouxia sp. C0005]